MGAVTTTAVNSRPVCAASRTRAPTAGRRRSRSGAPRPGGTPRTAGPSKWRPLDAGGGGCIEGLRMGYLIT